MFYLCVIHFSAFSSNLRGGNFLTLRDCESLILFGSENLCQQSILSKDVEYFSSVIPSSYGFDVMKLSLLQPPHSLHKYPVKLG